MQNKDDDQHKRAIPKETAGLFLHRFGIDCGFRNRGLICERADGKVGRHLCLYKRLIQTGGIYR